MICFVISTLYILNEIVEILAVYYIDNCMFKLGKKLKLQQEKLFRTHLLNFALELTNARALYRRSLRRVASISPFSRRKTFFRITHEDKHDSTFLYENYHDGRILHENYHANTYGILLPAARGRRRHNPSKKKVSLRIVRTDL
ncbi:hypothetical protein TSAR_008902 [Trichomalopsis sarcophagae]|uniref:Uncharacterized protein n=1 Tax=Trichomalopsis sarcophagae TaxID=543379 RepID=A0A232EVJ9_9HYME|nr:hypothetical protein TSAR_008902 [Trichomalopsis sarcophagae]